MISYEGLYPGYSLNGKWQNLHNPSPGARQKAVFSWSSRQTGSCQHPHHKSKFEKIIDPAK